MARLFQKPKLENKEQLAQLGKDIFAATQRMEGLSKEYFEKHTNLERDFQREKNEKARELFELKNTLDILRSERAELEKPINHKLRELTVREDGILEKEKHLIQERQTAFEREREAERKLADVQNLSDQLGETRVRQLTKERLLDGREASLKDKETHYLLKIERFSHEVNEATAKTQERENAVMLKELNVQGKEENLEKREKELLNGHILLNDQRGTLARAWEELKRKKHGRTASPKR